MLWKRDSKQNGALYIDYFAKFNIKTADLDEIYSLNKLPQKSNAISTDLRNEGNIAFQAKNWNNAMVAYNYALCFAEQDSEALSLAYANRSACFFEMDRFENSFSDIELAEKNSLCSAELKQQIKHHREDCLDFIGNDSPCDENDRSKLEFKSNEKFPALSHVLQTERCDTRKFKGLGYRITASCDIDVGQTICVEKSSMAILMSGRYSRCSICFSKNSNLIPCENCTNAMFCQDKCQHSILHEAECNLNPDINVDGKLQFLIRTISYAISLFNGIDELIYFVEQSIGCAIQSIPWTMAEERAKYLHFLKMKSDPAIVSAKKHDPIIYFAYRAIMESKTGEMFSCERQMRFLFHLIWQHNAIITLGHVLELTNSQQEPESLSLPLMFGHFNHSCTPNAMYHLVGNTLSIVTLTPIEAGEQIFISYSGKETIFDQAKDDKLKKISKCFVRKCQCDSCHKRGPNIAERAAMLNDQCYKFLNCYFGDSLNPEDPWDFGRNNNVSLDIEEIKQNAITFLRKYGHCTWCRELAKVATCFMDVIWLQSQDKRHSNC